MAALGHEWVPRLHPFGHPEPPTPYAAFQPNPASKPHIFILLATRSASIGVQVAIACAAAGSAALLAATAAVLCRITLSIWLLNQLAPANPITIACAISAVENVSAVTGPPTNTALFCIPHDASAANAPTSMFPK